MIILFVHGWSVRHTETYGDLPRWLATQTDADGRRFEVENVFLGKYISFDDTVTVDDIARALQHAIRQGRVVLEDEMGSGGFVDSTVRSAGAPAVVLRERGPRDFEEIPPSELQLVARRLVRDQGFKSGSDAHLRAVLEFFDLRRLTVQVGTRMLDILARRYPYVDELLDADNQQK